MKGKLVWALALAAVLAAPAWAQRHMMQRYDVSQEMTLQGTVLAVDEVDCDMCGGVMGTHVRLQTDEGEKEIVLGPKSFLDDRGLALEKGDEIEVVAAPMRGPNGDQLVARELTRKGKTLKLRGKDGRPRWAGRGRRGR